MRLLSSIVIILALGLAGPASAVPITVNGEDYNIEWKIGTFADVNASIGLTDQIWWGNGSLASTFAVSLGVVDDGDFNTTFGPMFAFGLYSTVIETYAVQGANSPYFGYRQPEFEFAYAYATKITAVPEPSSALLLSLGLIGLAATRLRRKAS